MGYGTLVGYFIHFSLYAGKDTILQEYVDIGLGLGTSAIAYLVNTSPNVGDSNYHVIMDNFFTSPELLLHLSLNRIATTGKVRANQMKNSPLQDLGKMA